MATQRDTYQLGTQGTSDHDIVHAINAMIAVLKGEPAPAPFHINSKKEALRLLAHYVGDIHQPLHVGAVYLDTSGQVIDPDDGGFDPKTETTGGNDLLLDRPGTVSRPRSLHHEWDAVKGIVVNMPVPDNFIRQARAVPVSSDPIDTWSVAWATESVLASQEAFKDLIYEPLDDNAKRYLVTLPDGYGTARGKVQRARVVQAGARLAQILNEIWP